VRLAQSLKASYPIYIANKKFNSLMTKLRKRKKDDDKIGGFLLGLAFGAIVYGFLSLFEKPRCPVCNAKIEQNVPECQNCHSPLTWE
jgi:hypothetical protein